MPAVPYEDMTVAELAEEHSYLRLERARLEAEGSPFRDVDHLLENIERLLRNKSRL